MTRGVGEATGDKTLRLCVSPPCGAEALQGTGVVSGARGGSACRGCARLGTVALLKPHLVQVWVRGRQAIEGVLRGGLWGDAC